MYRSINQHIACFPASNQAVKQKIAVPKSNNLTPQETEQLSEYVSDDSYVQRQKQDIRELTSLFRDMLSEEEMDNEEEYLAAFRRAFRSQADFSADYSFDIEEKKKKLIVSVQGPSLECGYGVSEKPDIEMQLGRAAMEDIVNGRMTFQRAFMSGSMKAKGDFKTLRMLDQLFDFEEK